MGARVYNPKTNQFTAPDPIKGGNENTYTYPNDPINKSDFEGLSELSDRITDGAAILITATACVVAGPLGCFFASIAVGAIGGAIKAGINAKEQKKTLKKVGAAMLEGLGWGALSGAMGMGAGAAVTKVALKTGLLKPVEKLTINAIKHEIKSNLLAYPAGVYGELLINRIKLLIKTKDR